MLRPMQQPSVMLITIIAIAILALIALVFGGVLVASVAAGIAELLVLVLPLALLSNALI
jgi:hypothetical protein